MHHVCKPKRMLTGLLAVVLAGFVVQSAAAFRVAQDESYAAGGGHATAPLVIPYLSHGIGVDQSQYSGQSSSSTPLVVIPYLSHGVGVGKSQYGGQGAALSHTMGTTQSLATQPSDVFTRAVERHIAFVNAMNATAPARPDNRGGTLGIGSTAASQPTAVRPDDRAGIRGITASDIVPRSQSTAVRPDERAGWGFRGIGTVSVSQSGGSTSSTDWNTVFMAGGALLGVLLIVAAAVALSRRQHGRVLAH